MLSVKGGTQTWSKAEQVSSLKGDGGTTMSAQDREKVLGDQDIGEYLNKIVDPNWVDPSKTRQVGSDTLDKDAFMKLFLAQLKNQDPMNPLQSHEMAAQLAQFTSLEKLNNIDEGIAGLNKNKNPRQNYEALSLIGKTVSGDAARLLRSEEKETHDIEFDLKADAQEATVSLRDVNGMEVKKLQVKGLKKGKNTVPWNGRSENGTPTQPGEYKVVIEAKNAGGQKVFAETAFEGKVTGINFTAQGPILLLGRQTVRLSEVSKIQDGVAAERMEKAKPVAQVTDARPTNGQTSDAPIAGMGSDLQNVGMSQGLINKIDQAAEVKK
jgi:flagellar basal-body rod modification protein FlgD